MHVYCDETRPLLQGARLTSFELYNAGIITVSPVNDELLAAVGKLTAEYGRIGGNLNQIARTLNEWHSPYPQLAGVQLFYPFWEFH